MCVTKEDYFNLLFTIFEGFIESEDFNDTLYDDIAIECVDDIYYNLYDTVWDGLHNTAFVSDYIRLSAEEKKKYIETHKDLLDEIVKNSVFADKDRIDKAIEEKDFVYLEKTCLCYYFSDAWEEYVYHVQSNYLASIIADRDEHFRQIAEENAVADDFFPEVELDDEDYDEGFDEALNRGLSVGKSKSILLSEGSKKGYKRFRRRN